MLTQDETVRGEFRTPLPRKLAGKLSFRRRRFWPTTNNKFQTGSFGSPILCRARAGVLPSNSLETTPTFYAGNIPRRPDPTLFVFPVTRFLS